MKNLTAIIALLLSIPSLANSLEPKEVIQSFSASTKQAEHLAHQADALIVHASKLSNQVDQLSEECMLAWIPAYTCNNALVKISKLDFRQTILAIREVSQSILTSKSELEAHAAANKSIEKSALEYALSLETIRDKLNRIDASMIEVLSEIQTQVKLAKQSYGSKQSMVKRIRYDNSYLQARLSYEMNQ